MKDLRASKRYADALFSLAEERDELQKAEQDLAAVNRVLEEHPQILRIVGNSTISTEDKEGTLEKIFSQNVSPFVLNFLKLLIEKNRFSEIASIQKSFHARFEAKKKIREVTVLVSRSLTDEAEKKLLALLSKKLDSEIRLAVKIDPSLIGGLVLRFDGREIDASYKHRLREIRQKLLVS